MTSSQAGPRQSTQNVIASSRPLAKRVRMHLLDSAAARLADDATDGAHTADIGDAGDNRDNRDTADAWRPLVRLTNASTGDNWRQLAGLTDGGTAAARTDANTAAAHADTGRAVAHVDASTAAARQASAELSTHDESAALSLAVWRPTFNDSAALVRFVTEATEAGVRYFDFEGLHEAPPEALTWLKQALRFARRR